MAGAALDVPDRPRTSWQNAGLICLILSVAGYRLSETLADPDLWGHLTFGQDILHTGQIVTTDPYSYLTAGHPWINHEWLAELFFALVFGLAGTPGLVALKVAVCLTIIGLSYRHLARQGLNPLRAGFVLLPVSLLLLTGLGTVRPQLFTCLLFLFVLLAIEAAERGNWHRLWLLPVIFAVWVNLHGGFLAGLAVLMFWSVGTLLRLSWHQRKLAFLHPGPGRTVVLVMMTCIAASLLNPYGAELPRFLLKTATLPRPEIDEWNPVLLTSQEGIVYLLVLAASVGALLAGPKERRPVLWAVFACLALAPLLARRHLPLFALGAVILAGEPLAAAWQRWLPDDASRSPGRAVLTLIGLSCWAGAGVLIACSIPHFSCICLSPEAGFAYPCRAVGRIQASGITGRMAVIFDWGEYVIWHLGPGVQVSVDGRRETVYPEEVYRMNMNFQRGVGEWDALLVPQTDLALVARTHPIFELLKARPGWVLLDDTEDHFAALFVREGWAGLEQLRQTPPPLLPADGQGLCFP
jgi:hypothetical protein